MNTYEAATKALEIMQLMPSEILALAATGNLDLNLVAKQELASRGLDTQGKWVGFEAAKKLHGFTN